MNIFLSFFIVNYVGNLGYIILNPKEEIKTKIRSIWLNKYDGKLFKQTNEFIEKNIKKRNETWNY